MDEPPTSEVICDACKQFLSQPGDWEGKEKEKKYWVDTISTYLQSLGTFGGTIEEPPPPPYEA